MRTMDDLRNLLAQAASADTAPEALTALSDEITALYEAYNTATTQVEDSRKKIDELRDSNMRLFLKISGAEPKEEYHEETLDELNARIKKEIMEG